jgi:hypothetical protein
VIVIFLVGCLGTGAFSVTSGVARATVPAGPVTSLAYNNAGTTNDGTAPVGGGFDGIGYAYSANALGTQGITATTTIGPSALTAGLTFTWPAARPDANDNVSNADTVGQQVIALPAISGATTLGFLGASSNGPWGNMVTINYTDGTTTTALLEFDDWGHPGQYPDNTTIASMPYRDGPTGAMDATPVSIYFTSVSLNPGKTATGITIPVASAATPGIPSTSALHIFAMAFGGSPAATATPTTTTAQATSTPTNTGVPAASTSTNTPVPPTSTSTSTPASSALVNCGSSLTALPPADDVSTSTAQPLGFNVNFFGTQYSSVYVNNNGNVTFDAPYIPFLAKVSTPTAELAGVAHDIIAPFYADVDTSVLSGTTTPAGTVTYGQTTYQGHAAFCVNWTNVGYESVYDPGNNGHRNTFQLLLVSQGGADFDIVMNYGTITWETGDGSGGSGGLGGISASVGYSNGTAATPATFSLPGSGVPGSFLDLNMNTGLIHTSHNSATPGQYIYLLRGGVPATPVATATATTYVPPAPPQNPISYAPAAPPLQATSTSTPVPTNTATDTPLPATATWTPTDTMTPVIVPAAPITSHVQTGSNPLTVAGKHTTAPSLQVHNAPATVAGGRRTTCDLAGNTNGKSERGCEVVSSVSAPGATVEYILTFPDGRHVTFTDKADSRGHSLHPFNVGYLPPVNSKKGSSRTVVHISVRVTLQNGTMLRPVNAQFSVKR